VNGDGRVTRSDATLITRATLGLAPFPSVELLPGFDKCDVTGESPRVCDVRDARLIQRATLGLPPGFDASRCTAYSGEM